MDNNDFNVMDMLGDYASENNMDASDIFKKAPVEVKNEEKKEIPVEEKKPEYTGMGVVYNDDEIEESINTELKNNADEELQKNGASAIEDLEWKEKMIEKAKARNNIAKLFIPQDHPEMLQVRIMMAASADNEEEAQKGLDEVLAELKQNHPEMIEFIDSSKETPITNIAPQQQTGEESTVTIDEESVKVIIDKQNVSDVTWSEEDLAKIKKARTIELNILDKGNIQFGSVKTIKGNAVDKVLSQYKRKTHDIVKALPASKYRATFTGLSYPEVLDLTVSTEMSSFDAEMKKWTIAFNHTVNPSIGPWKEYIEYPDPNTGEICQLPIGSELPDGVDDKDAMRVTTFDDFMKHTSFLDLNYILWNILCATAMESEIISIKCKNMLTTGRECGNTYDWVYKPSDLLVMDSISDTILEDVKNVSEASSKEETLSLYNSSLVANKENFVELTSSGFYVFYGHANAYAYMDDIYGRLDEVGKESKKENPDPTLISKTMAISALQIVNSIIIRDEDGSFARVTDTEDILKILQSLDEIDWKILNELSDMLIKPYQFKYSIRGLVCKKCNTRSSIPIPDMSRMLFIVAQSLQSVQVKLTKN